MKIIQRPSPNFNQRKNDAPIDTLIIHYTDMTSAQAALDLLQDPQKEVSAHYLIDETGQIFQLVDEKHRAWHAGVSSWNAQTDINSRSIGIELANPGHGNGYKAFPKAQMDALIQLCQKIVKNHVIPAYNIIAHSDIAPDRKKDPGELFNWQEFAENGFGLWHDITDTPNDHPDTDALTIDPETLTTLFNQLGYDTSHDLKTIITAFQRHFEPEKFKQAQTLGQADALTLRRLQALNSQKKKLLP